MTTESTVADRAYAMAQMWANDPDRLAAMLASKMQAEEWAEICVYLAASFSALTDDSISHEATARAFWTHMAMIHGIVVERVMLPIAEQLAKTDHDEKTWALGWSPVQIKNAERDELRAA